MAVKSSKPIHFSVYIIIWISSAYLQTCAQDLCANVSDCHCYNAWEETRADCTGDLTYVPAELPLNLTQLRISGSENFIELTNNNMSKYSDLNMVELYSNGLQLVQSDAFNSLSDVDQLLFHSNPNLASLPGDVFQPLQSLEFLDMHSNALTSSVFDTFAHVQTLKTVNLDGNPLKGNVPAAAFGHNSDLATVYLSGCSITGIASNAFQNMDGLISIYLDFNNITQLTVNAFTGLSKVTTLHIAFNSIQTLGVDVFGEISSTVQVIDLSYNAIHDIDDNAFRDLKTLQTLFINFNVLTEIPSIAIKQIPRLDLINLSGNQIRNVYTNAFSGLAELNSISLCDMESLINIEEGAFDGIANMTSLLMYSNPSLLHFTLAHLPDEEHDTLEVLRITGNAFRTLDLDLFINKPALQHVDLNTNPYHCDCYLSWMPEVYDAGYIWASHWGNAEQLPILCFTPKHLHQFRVLSMKPQDFTCDAPEVEEVSPLVIEVYLNGNATFKAHALNGIPATRWIGPLGGEHIPVRPTPEANSKNNVTDPFATIYIRPKEEFNVTDDVTIVMASLEFRNINQSAAGMYELIVSNHIANVSVMFELQVLPYQQTTPMTTIAVDAVASISYSYALLLCTLLFGFIVFR